MRQWLRKVRATFTGDGGELVVEALKIAFRVSKVISGTPNAAEIEIWNLSRENRMKIKKEFDKVRIEAGYEGSLGGKGNVGIIFEGFIRDIRHRREDTDIITTVESGDGDKGIRQGVISKTFPAGTKPSEMIEELRKRMPGVDKGVIQDAVKDLPAYKRPVVMCGPCRKELDKIGRTHNLYWGVQDGAMEVVSGDSYVDEVVVISQQTGMIGIPDITDDGIRVSCLLNPQLRIARVVEIRSETLEMNDQQGRFRVSCVDFQGDNRDGDFTATVAGDKIDGGKVKES